MHFIINRNLDGNRNKIILHPDNSFGSSYDDKEPWDFQVSLTPSRSIMLNFNKLNKKCISCEGFFLGKPKKTICKSLDALQVIKARLLFNYKEVPEYGIELLLEDDVIYYDKLKNMIACGDLLCQGDLIEFGIGQYIKLKNNRIAAIYIVFQK